MYFSVKKLKFSGIVDFYRIFKGIKDTDCCFIWFANVWSVAAIIFSKIYKKKVIIIAGGYDAANEPKINYGLMQHPILKYFAKFSFNNADLVLAVSHSTKRELIENTKIKDPIVIYNGVDAKRFYPKGEKDRDLIITVGAVNKGTLAKKGLTTFVKSAKYLPEKKFLLIGKHADDSISYLNSIAPNNVEFTGFVTSEELLSYMQRAKVYVQVSAHESFGVAVAEAMLCECVPVVSDQGALPEVVGGAGFYVRELTPEETAKQIGKAIDSDLGKKARERIINNFSMEKREGELIKIISELVGD
jgi:glycosyltransferase involved in cell wall biosynthesis